MLYHASQDKSVADGIPSLWVNLIEKLLTSVNFKSKTCADE